MTGKDLENKVKEEHPKFYTIEDGTPTSIPLIETKNGLTFAPGDPDFENYRRLWDKDYKKSPPPPPGTYLGRIHDSEITE